MRRVQPKVACVVIPFAPKPLAAAYLTSLDRMEINRWRDQARRCGYDRMVIHEREPRDLTEMGNFLSLYRTGECWSRWVFARMGAVVSVWCSVTGVDLGEFPTLSQAFQAVMPVAAFMRPILVGEPPSNIVTTLLPRLKQAVGG